MLSAAMVLGTEADATPQLLVKWTDGPSSFAALAGNARVGAAVKRNFSAVGWQLVELPYGMSLNDGLEVYRRLEGVLLAEPDRAVPLVIPPSPAPANPIESPVELGDRPRLHGSDPGGVRPNDPLFNQQWHLRRIAATNAWATTTGNSNVVVAVIDTGINYSHEDLAPNMWHNPGESGLANDGRDKATNGEDDDDNGYVDDVYGIDLVDGADPFDEGVNDGQGGLIYHGTASAGVIGAVGNNGKGVAGISWYVQLMAIRTASRDNILPASRIIAAFDYLITMRRRGVNIRVTSNSYMTGTSYSQAEKDSIEIAGSEGILSVFSAGNFSNDVDKTITVIPAAYDLPSIISVANSDQNDVLRPSSSYGRTGVDLAAPGVGIVTTSSQNDYFFTYGGTSAATPMVAGAAALLLALEPNATIDQLKAAIFGSVDQPAALKGKSMTNGRLNVARALDYLGDVSDAPAIVLIARPGGLRTDTNAAIQLTFSRAMDRASVENALIVTPPYQGDFHWSNDSRSLSFAPDVPFGLTNHTVRILGSARDSSGRTLDGNFSRSHEGSPGDDFVWTFGFPLANDDFVNAQLISGPFGSIKGTTRNASLEPDEPFHVFHEVETSFNSVWYRWTAPEPGGWITFDLTSGTSFDSLLAIYTGNGLEHLVSRGSNDNYGTRTGSRVSLAAVPGETFALAVAGKGETDPAQFGGFLLAWYATPAPGFTGSQFSPVRAMPGTRVTLTGTNFTGATAVVFGGASAIFANALTNNLDLRITATVPPDAASGPIKVVTPHGYVTSSASFEVLPPPLAVRRTPENQIEISWPATGNTFALETTLDLGSPLWEPLPTRPIIAEGQSRVVTSIGVTGRYFRLRGQP